MQAQKLGKIGLFSSLGKRDLQQLAGWTDELVVPEGDDLVTEGRLAHEFFVIEDGTAEVRRNGARVADLGPGDFFGEMGLLDEAQRRTASVVATSEMRLVVMFEREFRQMEREMPVVADRVRSAVRERLAD